MQKRFQNLLNIFGPAAIAIIIFAASTLLLFYSKGYRFDREERKVEITGIFDVKSSPSRADVYFNSEKKGTTTEIIDASPDQQHNIRLLKEGYQPWEVDVSVEKEESFKVDAQLIKNELEETTLFNITGELIDVAYTEDNSHIYIIRKTISTNSSQDTGDDSIESSNEIDQYELLRINIAPGIFTLNNEPEILLSFERSEGLNEEDLRIIPSADNSEYIFFNGDYLHYKDSELLNTINTDIEPFWSRFGEHIFRINTGNLEKLTLDLDNDEQTYSWEEIAPIGEKFWIQDLQENILILDKKTINVYSITDPEKFDAQAIPIPNNLEFQTMELSEKYILLFIDERIWLYNLDTQIVENIINDNQQFVGVTNSGNSFYYVNSENEVVQYITIEDSEFNHETPGIYNTNKLGDVSIGDLNPAVLFGGKYLVATDNRSNDIIFYSGLGMNNFKFNLGNQTFHKVVNGEEIIGFDTSTEINQQLDENESEENEISSTPKSFRVIRSQFTQ